MYRSAFNGHGRRMYVKLSFIMTRSVEGLNILYLKYHSVCPFVRIGFAYSLSRKRVSPPPPEGRGGGAHSLVGGGPNSDDGGKAWHSVYSVLTYELGDDFDAVSLGEFLGAAGQLSALKVGRQASNLLPIRHFFYKVSLKFLQ
jgi:hypothetical protein